MPNRARAPLTGLVLTALLTAGCGSGSDLGSPATAQTGSSNPAAGGTVQVVLKSLFFNPPAIHAVVGQQVTWTQEDQAPHNVTYVSGPKFASSGTLVKLGATFSIRLTEPGTIHYVCTLHSWMKATIDVSP
jgi:plastocyanin